MGIKINVRAPYEAYAILNLNMIVLCFTICMLDILAKFYNLCVIFADPISLLPFPIGMSSWPGVLPRPGSVS